MLSRFFINRPIFATVLSILIVVAGVITLRSLPVEQYPTITPPTVVVEAQYPGANATTIAQMVATPIEQQVNGVEGMLYMSSTSSSAGVYRLTVTFEVGTDLDMATVLVQNRVNMTLSSLPQEVTKIGVTTTKESTNVVMFLTLTSDNPSYDALYLSNYAELNLVNELSRVKGVGSVGEFGAGNYSMRLWLNPDLLTIRGISPQEIISAIESQNIQVAPGAVGAPPLASPVAFQYTLETQGLLVNEEEFGNIIVKTLSDGRYLRLKDVATIELGSQTYSINALLKGQAVAAIAIYQLPGANALDVAQRIKARVNTLSSYLPEGVHLNITLDTTEFIHASVKEIYKTLGTAFLLVLIVILIFLQNWRAMLIPLIRHPGITCRDLHVHGSYGIFHQYTNPFRVGAGHRVGSGRRNHHCREQLPPDRDRKICGHEICCHPSHERGVGGYRGHYPCPLGRVHPDCVYWRGSRECFTNNLP